MAIGVGFRNFALRMTTKLTIDEGNSSTKLGLWHGDHLTEVVTLRHATLDDLSLIHI